MDIRTKVKTAATYAQISQSELATRLSMSPQSLSQRLKTGKFTISELESIANALGVKFECKFVFPDGQTI